MLVPNCLAGSEGSCWADPFPPTASDRAAHSLATVDRFIARTLVGEENRKGARAAPKRRPFRAVTSRFYQNLLLLVLGRLRLGFVLFLPLIVFLISEVDHVHP